MPRRSFGADAPDSDSGVIVGDPVAAKVGAKILQEGGNAIDAAIATAFAAGICTPRNCGIGGYGGHAMIALAGGRKITSIDFNSVAPATAHEGMFPLDEKGAVKGNVNTFGWLAAGVPGTAAGLELALRRYGTRSLRDTLAPAIELCESGRHVAAVKGLDDVAAAAPAAPPNLPPERQRNRDLARLLRQLAADNSTESFYRGEIAAKIADAFRRHGGLVTRADLAAYQAREVTPLSLDWNGLTLHTAPLTATGALWLEAIAILQALDWSRLPPPQRQHAKLEALRIAWADRQRHWGDPEQVKVPVGKLLSSSYAAEQAALVTVALKAGRPVPLEVDPSRAGGTTHLSAGDRHGNMIAITLTHGGSFGARVVVDGLGLVLGHGMSRFDPRPGRPNSPGPRKRPINNMCPTLVTRGGIPVLAAGGAGGTRIPNSLYEVLLNHVGLGESLEAAMTAPRLDTNGTLSLGLEKSHTAEDEAFFRALGYTTRRGPSANISAVSFDPVTGRSRGFSNGGY
jgi:gamma-glutamyltranspeptidase/glutathione hydrolase